ncbi:MAG: metallophosphoesterase family protein [Bryobacteraceae bacterium]|nr:metallophosphoesterase family protein [Bryobacteraceae bacterium]
MRYLILSDIHANWPALEAVLTHAAGAYDTILCCGDLVGYGPDPNRVVEWARESVSVAVRGNHDKACTGSEDLEWFNPVARAAAEWTMNVLTPANAEYLRNLPKGPVQTAGFQILHGSPLDEDEYLINTVDVAQLAGYIESRVSFFGHTHIQGGFLCHRNGVKRIGRVPADHDEMGLDLEPDVLYLINPGSVGQPRDLDPRAAYAVFLPEHNAVIYRRTPYDIASVQNRIRQNGLPDLLAQRLSVGQ